MPKHSRQPEDKAGQGLLWGLVALLVVLLGGGGYWLLGGDDDPGTADGDPGSTAAPAPAEDCGPVTVWTYPELLAAVQAAADRAGDGCFSYDVQERATSVAQAEIRKGGRPDVWLPSSVAWAQLAADDGVDLRVGEVVASSPVLLVGQPGLAGRLEEAGLGPEATFTEVARLGQQTEGPAPVRLRLGDPRSDPATMALISGTEPEVGGVGDADGPGRGLLAVLAQTAVPGDPLAVVASDVEALVPVTEQQLAAADDQELEGVGLSSDLGTVQVPFVRVGGPDAGDEGRSTGDAAGSTGDAAGSTGDAAGSTGDAAGSTGDAAGSTGDAAGSTTAAPAAPGSSAAVDALEAELTGDTAAGDLAALGLRPGTDGPAPDVTGVPEGTRVSAETPDVGLTAAVARTWAAVAPESRILTLVDISGSMEATVEEGVTRIDLARRAVQTAVSVVPERTALGLWWFATGLDEDLDHVEAAPIRPLGEQVEDGTHQDVLLEVTEELALDTLQGDTGLHDSLWAAYRAMQEEDVDDAISSVLMLTDGQNNDSTGGLSQNEVVDLLEEARAEGEREVTVVLIGVGPDVEADALDRLATAAGGESLVLTDPRELPQVFVDVVARRAP